MSIRHTGACSERFLNARLKLCPLKEQYRLVFSYVDTLSPSSALRAVTFAFTKEIFDNEY